MAFASFILVVAKYACTRLADIGCRVLSSKGEDMAPQTTTRAKPDPAQPIVTVEDIDEALHHTSRALERNDQWWRWADHLLDERNRLHPATQREAGTP
jgi:hypothetical protein